MSLYKMASHLETNNNQQQSTALNFNSAHILNDKLLHTFACLFNSSRGDLKLCFCRGADVTLLHG